MGIVSHHDSDIIVVGAFDPRAMDALGKAILAHMIISATGNKWEAFCETWMLLGFTWLAIGRPLRSSLPHRHPIATSRQA